MTTDLDITFDETLVTLMVPDVASNSTELFNENFKESFRIDSLQPGMLPPGLLYTNELHTLLIFERPPAYKNIGFCNAKKPQAARSELQHFNIAVPWQVYIAEYELNGTLTSLAMFYADSEIDHVSVTQNIVRVTPKSRNTVMNPALTNIYENGLFCLDTTIASSPYPSLETRMAAIHNLIWESVFNTDLTFTADGNMGHVHHAHKAPCSMGEYATMFAWYEEQTLADVVFGEGGVPLFTTRDSNKHKLNSDHNVNTQLYNNLFGVVPLLV